MNGSRTPQLDRQVGAGFPDVGPPATRQRTMSDNGMLDGGGHGFASDSRPMWSLPAVVTAMFSYTPRSNDELTLRPGDRVQLLSRDYRDSGTEGWWVGELNSCVGVFPASYVNHKTTTTTASTSASNPVANVVEALATPASSTINVPVTTTISMTNNHIISGMGATTLLDKRTSIGTPSPPSLSLLPSLELDSKDVVVYGNSGAENDQEGGPLAGEVPLIPADEIVKGEHIGSGAFGTVYCGSWLDKDIALKVFNVSGEQVHQEAGHLIGLQHLNIVQLLGMCQLSCGLALVMERAFGGALSQLLEAQPVLGPRPLLNMALQIAEGMRYLHTVVHLCHRDLKASNILIREPLPRPLTEEALEGKTLVITDFGMARQLSQMMAQQSKFGTVAYAAPEVCRQQVGFSTKSDVWSYGVVLWEMITFDLPFRGMEHPHLLYKIAKDNHTLCIPDGCPSILGDLLSDCWRVVPEERPTFEEILDHLCRAREWRFMAIPAVDFHELQANWREQIERQTLTEEQGNSEAINEEDVLELIENLQIERETLDRERLLLHEREMEVHRKEQRCNQFMDNMGHQCMLLAVMTANFHGQRVGPPPRPPPRKTPFYRTLFGLRKSSNGQGGASGSGGSKGDGRGEHQSSAYPVISPPCNLQHVVHVAPNEGEEGGLKLISHFEQQKVNTWGPSSMNRTHARQSVATLASGENPMFKSAPNLVQKLNAQISLQDGNESSCSHIPDTPTSPRARKLSGGPLSPSAGGPPPPHQHPHSNSNTLPANISSASAGNSLSWRHRRNQKRAAAAAGDHQLPPQSPSALSSTPEGGSGSTNGGGGGGKGTRRSSKKPRAVETALRRAMRVLSAVTLGWEEQPASLPPTSAGCGTPTQFTYGQQMSGHPALLNQLSLESRLDFLPGLRRDSNDDYDSGECSGGEGGGGGSTGSTNRSRYYQHSAHTQTLPSGRDAYIKALQDGYLCSGPQHEASSSSPSHLNHHNNQQQYYCEHHQPTLTMGGGGGGLRYPSGSLSTSGSTLPSPVRHKFPARGDVLETGPASHVVEPLAPPPLPVNPSRPSRLVLSKTLSAPSPSASTNTLLDTDCPEDPTLPVPAAETPKSRLLRRQHHLAEVHSQFSPTTEDKNGTIQYSSYL